MKPILFNFPMPITTNRLLLRQPMSGDGKCVNDAVLSSFKELHKVLPWAEKEPSVDESEEYVRQAAANWILKKNEEPYLPLFIFDRKNNEFLGGTGYNHLKWEIPALEIGYWLKTSHVGKGFMTEAVNAITQYAFKEIKAKRVTITCDANNIRSKNVAERLGYSLEGIIKFDRREPITNEISDTLLYARYDLLDLPKLEVNW